LGIDTDLPTGALSVITGVSGSGKSTLIMDVLVTGLRQKLQNDNAPAAADSIEVDDPDGFRRLVVVNQQPIGRTPRSTPATYTKVMDALRKLFATTLQAKERGWGPGRFSFNAATGRCAGCEGRGAVLVEMHFLSDVWILCEQCHGRRYNDATLVVRWRGLNIAEVLDLRVSDALELFGAHRMIARKLQALHDVGLGYLRLGQPATTLSGGEAQRVKLANELHGRGRGTIFVLDEPTTGLHFADIERLVDVLHRLVDQGATVLVIEHNPDVIKNADHVLDLGPEGGVGGGRVMGSGPPEALLQMDSATGQVLRRLLA
jgi:excinuclease ABC subunit A